MNPIQRLLLACISAASLFLSGVHAASSQLAASVSGVAVDKPIVVRANQTDGVTISASVAATFDSDPVPAVGATSSWVDGATSSVSVVKSSSTVPYTFKISGTTYNGYMKTEVTDTTATTPQSRTTPETVTSYLNKLLKIDDGAAQLYTSAIAYTKNYPVGVEGINTLTISAVASEEKDVSTWIRTDTQTKVVVTETTAVTIYMPDGVTLAMIPGKANPSTSSVTLSSSTSDYLQGEFVFSAYVAQTPLTGSPVSAGASYIVDLAAPSAFLWPDNNAQSPEPSIRQSQAIHPHVRVLNGSSGQPYTWTATVTAPDGTTTYSSTCSGTFGKQGNGVANPENRVWDLTLPCDAPLGQYSVSVTADSTDLAGNDWPTVTMNGGTFTVTSGLNLAAQSFVVAQLADGSYGVTTAFTDTYNKKTLANNTTPGSFHATTTITTAGPCAGFGSYAPSSLTILLDPNFSFADTGGSPTVHVFVGLPGQGGSFDLNSGAPLQVVTLPYTVVTDPSSGGPAVSVDLTSLGPIPSTWVIYARAHCRYSPPAGRPNPATYMFTSGASSADIGPAGTNTSALTLTSVLQTGGGK